MPLLTIDFLELKTTAQILEALKSDYDVKEYVTGLPSISKVFVEILDKDMSMRLKILHLIDFAGFYLQQIAIVLQTNLTNLKVIADSLYSLIILNSLILKMPVPKETKELSEKMDPNKIESGLSSKEAIKEVKKAVEAAAKEHQVSFEDADLAFIYRVLKNRGLLWLDYANVHLSMLFGISFPNIVNRDEFKVMAELIDKYLQGFRQNKDIAKLFPKDGQYRIREIKSAEEADLMPVKIFPILFAKEEIVFKFDIYFDEPADAEINAKNRKSLESVLKKHKIYALEKVQ